MEELAIYGAGGFGRETACLINAINAVEPTWKLIGFFDDGLPKGLSNNYGQVLGGIKEVNQWNRCLSIIIAIAKPVNVKKIVEQIENPFISFPNIIAPGVLFLDREQTIMGCGNLIGFRAVVCCNVSIGNFNLFNFDVILGHDTSIGNYNMFNPSVRIAGEVNIGDHNFFGVSSIVLQQKKIGNSTTIAANSVVMRDTEDGLLYIGNPAVKVRNLNS